jgi:transcriptional regulator with XRE-family HTH domain
MRIYTGNSWEIIRNKMLKALSPYGSVSKFCRDIGVSRNSVDKWLSNTSSPNIEHLDVIANGLHQMPWDLIRPDSEILTYYPEIESLRIALETNQEILSKISRISAFK